MPLDANAIHSRIATELKKISHPLVRASLSPLLLSTLTSSRRRWDKGEDEYPCWTVAEHKASDVALVYADLPSTRAPWSVVPRTKKWFGINQAWFTTLEQAFCESPAAADLKIWSVCSVGAGDRGTVVADELTLDDALAECTRRNQAAARPIFRLERQGAAVSC